jgi:prepilin-type N-terminal cleavage/methylation domain-containing protein
MCPTRCIAKSCTRENGDGFTLVELIVAGAIAAILLTLIPRAIAAVSDATAYSQGTTAGSDLAETGLQQMTNAVESASQVCLPTQMTTVGPTVTSGFAVRVLSSAFGKSLWDQWMLNTTTHVLEMQAWPTTWTTGNAVPPWIPIAQGVSNSTTAPFSLPSSVTGSPQSLAVDLQISENYGNKSQAVELKATIAAFDTPYSSNPSVTCATAATQEGWT